jgi:hypothetical protein
MTKAFVEFDTILTASYAKTQMEGKLLLKDGTKANVFYANIQKIVFKTDSSSGKGKNSILFHNVLMLRRVSSQPSTNRSFASWN